jgi:hypothetical protein
VGERDRRLVDVGADQAIDARSERAQSRDPSASRVERRHGSRRPPLGRPDGAVKRLVYEGSDGWVDPQPLQEGEPPGLRHTYQAVEVAASVMPCASSQRSASIAALQPSAAAVTAWR